MSANENDVRNLALRFTDFAAAALGAEVHERCGCLLTFAATSYLARSIHNPAGSTVWRPTVDSTYDGSPTLSGRVNSCYDGEGLVAFVAGTEYAWTIDETFSNTRSAFTEITVARDIRWSTAGQQFVAIGENASGDGRIETSPDGSTWTERVTGRSANNGYSLLASTVESGGQLLAAPQAGSDWAYSSDGGTTWTVAPGTPSGDTAVTATGLCFDAQRGLWLATFLYSSFSGDVTRVWGCDDPLVGVWTARGAALPRYSFDSGVTACGVACIGGVWVAGCPSNTNAGNTLLSFNGGETWPEAIGYGRNRTDGVSIRTSRTRAGMTPAGGIAGLSQENSEGVYLILGSLTGADSISRRIPAQRTYG